MTDKSLTLEDHLLRFASHFDHYGTCGRCGISWKYREPQVVQYGRSVGGSPLCKQCFDDVDPIIATRYFKRMWVEDWERDLPETREPWQTFLSNAARITEERDGEITTSDPRELREWADV